MKIRVNGAERDLGDVDPSTPLLWVLRDELALTGTKFGCGRGLCGACTVHVGGVAMRSCMLPVQAVQAEVTTIEGLSQDGDHPVQQAWRELCVPQCGYCQSGSDHVGVRVAGGQRQALRRGHRRRDGRQHLPLRHLPAHPRGDPQGRGRCEVTSLDSQGVDRRSLLRGLVSGGALVLGANLASTQLLSAQALGASSTGLPAEPLQPSIWLSIADDGALRIWAHRSEMGTGIRTSLPMVVADELGANWDRVTIEQALGDARYGSQNTDGSRSIRRFYTGMRQAGAAARMLLERAAANAWGVDASQCEVRDHAVHGPGGKQLGFGELVAKARELDVPKKGELVFRKPEQRRYVFGSSDTKKIVRGWLCNEGCEDADVTLTLTRLSGGVTVVPATVTRCIPAGGKVRLRLDANRGALELVWRYDVTCTPKDPLHLHPLRRRRASCLTSRRAGARSRSPRKTACSATCATPPASQ